MQLLVERGVSLDDTQHQGKTPLYVASEFGHDQVVQLLTAAGATLEARGGKRGFTPLIVAAHEGHARVVAALIESGAEVDVAALNDGVTSLIQAVVHNHSDVVSLLLEEMADINAQAEGPIGSGLCTPLHYAVLLDNLEMGKLLLTKGTPDLTAQSSMGTPLGIALKFGRQKFVELLCEIDWNGCEEEQRLLAAEIDAGGEGVDVKLLMGNVPGVDDLGPPIMSKPVELNSSNDFAEVNLTQAFYDNMKHPAQGISAQGQVQEMSSSDHVEMVDADEEEAVLRNAREETRPGPGYQGDLEELRANSRKQKDEL